MTRACVFAPSPTLTITVEAGARPDEDEIHLHAGGQGLWVARMMRAFGADVVLCGALGGETGGVLDALIEAEGIRLHAVEGDDGNGAYLHDRRSGERRSLAAAPASRLSRHALDDLYAATVTEGLLADVTVVTGADDHVLPSDVFRRLAADLSANERLVVADLSGDQVLAVARGGAHVVKVSEDDLRRDGLLDGESLRPAVDSLRAQGAGAVVVTRAERPLLAFWDGEAIEVRTPIVEAADPHGAGDSLTGALAVTLAGGAEFRDALRAGAAAGTMNVTRRGLATGAREDVERMAALVELRSIEEDESVVARPHHE